MSKKDIEDEVVENDEKDEDEIDEDEKEVDAEIKDVASKISAALNLDELSAKVDKILEKDSMAAKVYSEANVKKVSQLTKEEKIVAFWHSLVTMDKQRLKALSEGVAADGGYLFPKNSLGKKNCVNCWELLMLRARTISSQAIV